jgi:hypothetical protein
MPTNRVPLHRRRRHLTWAEEMSLEWGEAEHRGIAFRTDQERREAWERHRDYLMARCDRGFRPQAWWDYDCPIPRPRDHDYEKAVLWEAGLLTDQERKDLEAQWREHYDQAQRPGFQFCIGHAKHGDTFATWIKGRAARRAQYKWAGIPHELVRRWTEERQRRSKATRKLRATTEEPLGEDASGL